MLRLTVTYKSEAYKYTTKMITKISGFLLLACFYR